MQVKHFRTEPCARKDHKKYDRHQQHAQTQVSGAFEFLRIIQGNKGLAQGAAVAGKGGKDAVPICAVVEEA